MSPSRVTKAVIPAAGLGTRFLPVTKAVPKEMLPIVDRPSIQYVVEEAARAGLTDVLIVTSRSKRAIEDHFDRNVELELDLERAGKHDLVKEVQAVTELADMHYVLQHEALGLGHAISITRDHVVDEPFAVLLGDDIMVDDAHLLTTMLEAHATESASVLALLEVEPSEISLYGCVEVEPVRDNIVRARSIVEKPRPEDAPSNLAVIGRYVFQPSIFDALDRTEPGAGGELQITDAIGVLMRDEPVLGVVFSEGRYDIGKKVDFLRANLELALGRDDLGSDVEEMIHDVMRRVVRR